MKKSIDWLSFFEEQNAMWSFHQGGPHASYEMASTHADFYFNTDVAIREPGTMRAIASELAAKCTTHRAKPSWIVSYVANVSCGLPLAAFVAEQLNCRFGYIDLRRETCSFQPTVNEGVILVTDDIHSGSSIRKSLDIIKATNGLVLPFVLTMANFSGYETIHGLHIDALFSREFNKWDAQKCPLCKQGSLAVPARQEWKKLRDGN